MSESTLLLVDQSEQDVLTTAVKLYAAHLQVHQDALHRYRLADDAVSALSKEIRAVDELLEKIRDCN